MKAIGDEVWAEFLESIESEVAELEAALLGGADLPPLRPLATDSLVELPEELHERARRALGAVMALEGVIANRLDDVSRELAAGTSRQHDHVPAYGYLDVDC